MRKHLDKPALYIPKLAFLESENVLPVADIQECLDRVHDIKAFIEFDLYLFIPLIETGLEELTIDIRGNRGKIHSGNVLIEHMYYLIDNETYMKRVKLLKDTVDNQ
ncbi:hypothetical protein RS130_19070 [Paraglaciecola aquimarina]|uniref:Uncharacterized protein n=1 Tax=Paraglaciecola aquimarina TaxID=1235557 RepID=A0ABU3T0A8_9ALTE|nr:hypothetical protein [Paraglaciecola aquimarina]MDU0355699.1 hypothetical protein [Paraglaciecola aquimarina]